LPSYLRVLAFLIAPNAEIISTAQRYLRIASFLLLLMCWLGSGVMAQIYRFVSVSTPMQRQQTKWVVFGLTAAVVGYFDFQLPLALAPALRRPTDLAILFNMIGKPVSMVLLLLAPISIMISLLRYRLWDIDPIIHRTVVYGGLTAAMAAFYIASVFVLQRLFEAITGQGSDLAIVLSTLAISALFQPLRRRLQNLIDRAFYREKVDFRRALTNFSREIRTIIELPELLKMLIDRTTEMLHIAHAAVFLYTPNEEGEGEFELVETRNLPPGEGEQLSLAGSQIGRLQDGLPLAYRREDVFSLLLPLTATRHETNALVGALALGPRLSGQRYTREDQTLLMGLADQAGTAIDVARLIEEREAEAQRRTEIERHLEAHRSSPIRRAEVFAENLLFEPSTALTRLYQLAQRAGQDRDAASLIDNLPQVLENLGAEPLANLAAGLNYRVEGELEPEVLPVGLRTLITQLESYPKEGVHYVCRWEPGQPHREAPHDASKEGLQHAAEALTVYRLCSTALEANTIPLIVELLGPLRTPRGETEDMRLFPDLESVIVELRVVAEALHAYERVDTSRDKLAYLASAVEQLRRVDYLARTELGSADRPVFHQIAENWLTVVTGAMGELQTRAQIVCRLLTCHTWQADVVPLVLSMRNDGRGAALNIRITLAPAPEYTLVDEGAKIERLAPGEEARVELRVRPHLDESTDHFRARFVILYTDPRGPDQVESFADVVRLLGAEGEFQFIPNPYVVGTPLEADSPLFFGREDVVAFVQENLTAQHSNNLVLIGQRRTGKTSLLKQLPVRLGDEYLPIYLDGQALRLDPGLPNFFLSLATEMAFALEDRGFSIDMPEYGDFAASPATFFERGFLTRVRQAIGDRHVVIMFDEFEELETAVKRQPRSVHLWLPAAPDPARAGPERHLLRHPPAGRAGVRLLERAIQHQPLPPHRLPGARGGHAPDPGTGGRVWDAVRRPGAGQNVAGDGGPPLLFAVAVPQPGQPPQPHGAQLCHHRRRQRGTGRDPGLRRGPLCLPVDGGGAGAAAGAGRAEPHDAPHRPGDAGAGGRLPGRAGRQPGAADVERRPTRPRPARRSGRRQRGRPHRRHRLSLAAGALGPVGGKVQVPQPGDGGGAEITQDPPPAGRCCQRETSLETDPRLVCVLHTGSLPRDRHPYGSIAPRWATSPAEVEHDKRHDGQQAAQEHGGDDGGQPQRPDHHPFVGLFVGFHRILLGQWDGNVLEFCGGLLCDACEFGIGFQVFLDQRAGIGAHFVCQIQRQQVENHISCNLHTQHTPFLTGAVGRVVCNPRLPTPDGQRAAHDLQTADSKSALLSHAHGR
jgi:hypothetical protein